MDAFKKTCFECGYERKDGICRKTKKECDGKDCNLWDKCTMCKNEIECHGDN